MYANNLVNELIEFFKESTPHGASSDVSEYSRLEDLQFDSFDLVEIVMKLEDKYFVKILDDEANKVVTIHDVATLIDSLRNR